MVEQRNNGREPAHQNRAALGMRPTLPPGFPPPDGLILAGGESRRMAGRDKALLPLADKPLLAHVMDRLQPQVATLFISANRHLDTYRSYAPVVPDAADLPANAGPLVGVASGLRACHREWLLCVPCDTPWLATDLAARLAEAVQRTGAQAAFARTAKRKHPVCLLIHRSLEPELSHWLRAGGRKVGLWLDQLPAAEAYFDHESQFANLNRPDELAWAEQQFGIQCNHNPKG